MEHTNTRDPGTVATVLVIVVTVLTLISRFTILLLQRPTLSCCAGSRRAFDDLVELSTVKPDAATPRTIVLPQYLVGRP